MNKNFITSRCRNCQHFKQYYCVFKSKKGRRIANVYPCPLTVKKEYTEPTIKVFKEV